MRCVVDDEVDACEVLERADVPPLSADDSALHVVGGKLNDGHRRLCGMARGNPLQSIRDEVACTAFRLRPGLVFEHADAPCELVPRLLLAAFEHQGPRIRLRKAGYPLELRD